MELEVGQLLHALPQLAGPAEGEPWELLPFEQTKPPTQTLNHQAFENLEAAYIPHEGERIAMRGRWIIDCGHNDFHTELHPITFMAFGHQVGSKTVVHVLANPYRVTELYGFGTGGVNSSPKGSTFPQALEDSITGVVQKGIGGVPAPISLLGGIERTQPSTAPFTVCPPAGAPAKPRIRDHFVTREGVSVTVKALKGTNCATVTARVGNAKGGFGAYTALQPPSRQCGLPYPLVSAEVAGGLGISGVKRNEVERITVNAAGATLTTSHGSLIPGNTGAFLATVVVLVPGGALDLHRFILSLIEQKVKAELEFAEEHGQFVGAISRIEANVAKTPQVACLDPLSGPLPNPEEGITKDQTQPFPYYGEVTVG